jgi:hypothetical protein
VLSKPSALAPGSFERCLEGSDVHRVGLEQDVAAGEQGPDVAEAEALADAAQLVVAHVRVARPDPPQQGDVLRHGSIVGMEAPCVFSGYRVGAPPPRHTEIRSTTGESP